MSVYLYHKGYFSRANRVRSVVEPIHRRLLEEQCTMPAEEWSALFEKVSRIDAKAEKGYYMQWTSLLQCAVGVPRPENDFKAFTFREMRQIRRKLRKLLHDVGAFQRYVMIWECYSTNLTLECWTATLRWACLIFTNGLRDNTRLYLA